MSWFEKIMPSRIKTERRTRSVPEGLWIKCPACDAVLYRAELERNLYVCPKCSHHMRMGARDRLERFLDPGTTAEIGASISPEDPLKFRDSKRYRDRLAQAQKATGESDALVVLAGTLHALPIVACAFEFQFLRGSMGSGVGGGFQRGGDYRGGAVAPGASPPAVHFSHDRSDHRRRVGESRAARGPEPRRAARADRLRTSPGHPADRARDPGRGVPAQPDLG